MGWPGRQGKGEEEKVIINILHLCLFINVHIVNQIYIFSFNMKASTPIKGSFYASNTLFKGNNINLQAQVLLVVADKILKSLYN